MNMNPPHRNRLHPKRIRLVSEVGSPAVVTSIPQAMPNITLFVYGTLKCGQWNHDHYCRSAISIVSAATVVGRLYVLPAGYPALEIPTTMILGHGTANPLADAAAQAGSAADIDDQAHVIRPEAGDWSLVRGELIAFADPLHALQPIDRLEGFRPGQRSHYQRVLVPVRIEEQICCAWTYIQSAGPDHQFLPKGIWPPAPEDLEKGTIRSLR